MLSDWGELRKPDVFTWKNIGWAVALHLAFFALCWLLSIPLPNKEIAIPIDLTVVVNENLDGDPDEPPPEAPPVKQPDPPPPPPPQPKVETPPPAPPPEEVKQDAVIQEKPKEKPKEKKIEKKPEKTKEELKKEKEDRLKKMRERAKNVKPEKAKPEPKQPTQAERLQKMRDALIDGPPPKNNGKTDKRPDNWEQLLKQGYRPGAKTQIAASENQRCISLIRSRFDTCWAQVGIPAWTDTLKPMDLQLKFSSSGKILSYGLTRSSGDRSVDLTVQQAAKLMNAVYGLSAEFLEATGYKVTIRVTVERMK